jgi:hypothetical protein
MCVILPYVFTRLMQRHFPMEIKPCAGHTPLHPQGYSKVGKAPDLIFQDPEYHGVRLQ